LSNKVTSKQIKYIWLLEQPDQELQWRPKWFIETLESILNQTVPLWELTICVTAAHVRTVREALAKYSTTHSQQKQPITVVRRKYAHPEKMLRTLIQKSQADWVAVLTGYNTLAIDATYRILDTALRQSNANVVYGDHEYLVARKSTNNIWGKPPFCEDLLCSQNYIGDFFAIRRTALLRDGAPTAGLELAWSHDLLLRMTEKTSSTFKPIVHVPSVLHHSRQRKPNGVLGRQTYDQSIEAVRKHFARKRFAVRTMPYRRPVIRNVWPLPTRQPKVSLIIPTRDGYKILKACVGSILDKTDYQNFEILIIDNQTTDLKTLRYFKHIQMIDNRVRVLSFNKPFNYSAINNFAVKRCNGEILGFINNDVEVLNKAWLTEMVSHAVRSNVGAVGALLYYPDRTVQHGGVIVGMHGVADHAFKGADPESPQDDPYGMLQSVRSADAVTAAVMLVRKDNFDAVGGFDARYLKVAFNDVDLCLKLRQQGLQIIYTPFAKLIHHESKTRRLDVSAQSKQTELYEHAIMKSRWGTDRLYAQQQVGSYV
jgi:GT2 family glycosyltransferase